MSIDGRSVGLAAGGDRAAQRAVYEALFDRVWRLLLRIVGPTDVDDVTQDVFMRLFANLGSFRRESEFSTWVHRLAVNEGLQHLRKVRRRVVVPLDEAALPSCRGRESDQFDRKEMLEIALSRLDDDSRILLHLKEVEQLSYAELAGILEIPEGTVGSRLNRARRDLKDRLLALGWEEGAP